MNVTKLLDLIEELNKGLGNVIQNDCKPILHVEAESNSIFRLYAFDIEIWNSVDNDTYTERGKLLDLPRYIEYRLNRFINFKEHQLKRIRDFLSQQIELDLTS